LGEALEVLQGAGSFAVLCGAGLSAESGIPTFRGPEGWWKNHRPEELATPEAFRRQPALVWEWYRMRIELVLAHRPNEAHLALARLGRRFPVRLLTQNVDGYHRRAEDLLDDHGTPSQRRAEILELHGCLLRAHCEDCGAERSATQLNPAQDVPGCSCGGRFRPSVVWFGESLDGEILQRSAEAVHSSDAVLSVGTSAVVWPAAGLIEQALRAGRPVLEINPRETPFSSLVSARLPGKAAEVLPPLVEELCSGPENP